MEMVLLLLLLLLGAAARPCLHSQAQKSVRLLRPPFSRRPRDTRSAPLNLPGLQDPRPLRIHACHLEDPVSDRTEGSQARGPTARALAAVREATRRLQGVLAGE